MRHDSRRAAIIGARPPVAGRNPDPVFGAGSPESAAVLTRRLSFDRDFPLAYAALWGAVALAVHLAFFPIGDLGVETDYYGELAVAARELWAGRFDVANYPYKGPLTSFLLAVVHPLARLTGGDWYRTGVLLNVLCGGAGLWLVYRLVRRLFGRAQAVATTVSVSLVYEYFLHAHKGSSDLLFFALLVAAIDRLVTGTWAPRRLLAAGALGGLAMLTRYNGLILPAAALPVLLLADPGRWPWRRRLLGCVLVAGAFLLTVAPWYAANLAQTGRPLATRHLQNIFVEEFVGAGAGAGAAAPGDAPRTLAGLIARDPAGFARTFLANVPRHLALDWRTLLGPLPGVMAALGLLRLLVARPSRPQTAFLACHLAYFLAMCLVYHQPRFFLPLLPGYFVLAWGPFLGPGPAAAAPSWRWRLSRPLVAWRGGWAAVVVAAATLAVVQVRHVVDAERYYYAQRPLFVLEAAPALREAAAQAGVRTVLARKPHLPFYAGLRQRGYPARPAGPAELVGYARSVGADAILVGPLERRFFPDLDWLDRLDREAGAPLLRREGRFTLYGVPPAAATDRVP